MASTISWKWVMARGALGVVLGLFAFANPAAALVTMTMLFAFYVAADGGFALAAALRCRRSGAKGWGFLALHGGLGLVFGFGVLAVPALALLTLAFMMAAWSFSIGVAQLFGALAHHRQIGNTLALGISGCLAIAFSWLLLFWPIAGFIALSGLLASFAIASGLTTLYWSLRLRSLEVPSTRGQLAHP